MLREISSQQFSEWLAFDRLEPIGERRADLRAAIIAQTIANVNRKPGSAPFAVADFLPEFDPEAAAAKQARESRALSERLKVAFKELERRREAKAAEAAQAAEG